jgi:Mg2+-importing ATPase
VTTEAGLTSAEAAGRLGEYGPNEPVAAHRAHAAAQLARLFANPLVLILLVASLISALLGQVTDAAIIATIVMLSVGINFWQTYRSEQAATRLRSLVTLTATVSRDGAWHEVPVTQVVPGDLIRLSAGDLVPADSRLIETRDLSVQQAMLTGESLPVDKAAPGAGSQAEPDATGPDAAQLVFLGTSVVSGTGLAIVTTTGARTLFGGIAERLSARAPESEFERGLRRFSLLILTTTITLVLFIVLVGIAFKHDAFESLLFAVALGVGLTPEFLPMITSVTLTQGALRMAREHVIVRQLPAIQNLGSIDILCSDKTGTLTSGTMQFDRSLDAAGRETSRAFTLASINSALETGIRSPFDTALLAHRPIDLTPFRKLDEIPFDFQRRCVSVVVEHVEAGETIRTIVTKGAPESVLAASTEVELDDAVGPLTPAARQACLDLCATLGADGFRVLAVASRRLDVRLEYSRADESHLVLAGIVSFADPLLPDAADMLAQLEADGVHVKILTGDGETVTRHVCGRLGVPDLEVVTGHDLDRLDDAALGHVAEQASVFARVSPAQKNRIILALKRRGHVVGFLGDGINDAPSLHTADVGISVMTATDVARQAAGIILAEPGLKVLHRGILAGRRASANTMKYLLMGTSSNFGNMFSMAAASLFLPFLPMLPTQILLNNFLYDVAQITIPGDRVDPASLQVPQRWDMRVIRDYMLFIGPISSLFDFLTFYALLRIFHASEMLFHTGWFVESLATQTLVLFVIRTTQNPLKSRPSRSLAITALAVVATGALLPVTRLAPLLGFSAPPGRFLLLLIAAVAVYLGLVEAAKAWLVRRHRA